MISGQQNNLQQLLLLLLAKHFKKIPLIPMSSKAERKTSTFSGAKALRSKMTMIPHLKTSPMMPSLTPIKACMRDSLGGGMGSTDVLQGIHQWRNHHGSTAGLP